MEEGSPLANSGRFWVRPIKFWHVGSCGKDRELYDKHFLSAYCVPGTVLGPGETGH